MADASSAKPSLIRAATPASFTLHQGDFGSAGVVVLKVFKTFSDAVLDAVIDDDMAADPGEGRAA